MANVIGLAPAMGTVIRMALLAEKTPTLLHRILGDRGSQLMEQGM